MPKESRKRMKTQRQIYERKDGKGGGEGWQGADYIYSSAAQ
jgi:hypothetical protein